MEEPKFTKGPLTVEVCEKWPFSILIKDKYGQTVFTESLACSNSKDKTFHEAVSAQNWHPSQRDVVQEQQERSIADAYLRAAAPELYWDNRNLEQLLLNIMDDPSRADEMWQVVASRSLRAKARGEA